MKKIFLALSITIFLSSCYDQGEIVESPRDIFQYQGKVYKAFRIGVGGGETIWVVLPNDSSDHSPIGIKYKEGKNEEFVTIIP